MSLLPIIYTSVLIFSGVVTTVLLVSYIIYKAKGGGPKPAAVQAVNPSHYSHQKTRQNNKIYTVSNHSQRNYKPMRNQPDLISYNKPVGSIHSQPVRRQPSVPRVQVINKPAEKKIVVVRKSNNNTSYDSESLLGYYNENDRGTLIQV